MTDTNDASSDALSMEEISQYIEDMPEDVLEHISFAVPWQYNSAAQETDPDGAPASAQDDVTGMELSRLRQECWDKFHTNPQLNTAVRGLVGRMVGMGFETTSEIEQIQDAIEQIETDPRNRLYHYYPKYVARNHIEGELFQCLTPHKDGFVEVDFIRPDAVEDILYHPFKTMMPLFFNVRLKNALGGEEVHQIPSIYVARYPKELVRVAAQNPLYNPEQQKDSRSRWSMTFRAVGGFHRFIVNWDRGYVQERALGYLRTVLKWLNKYEMLKNWEIDYKKSASAYVWTVSITDPRKFKLWLSMTEAERAATGLTAKKTPGGTLVLPPGFELAAKNPNLPRISDSDTDILDMVSSGLNESVNTMMGKSQGSYASAKEHRGPMTDRTSDELAYFERYLRHDFWGSIFFLKHKVAGFPPTFRSWEALNFNKKGKPKFGYKKRRPEDFIEFAFPISETIDYESRAKGLMGTKHGPLSETAGVPQREISRRMGFGGWGRMRLRKATEEQRYPKLLYTMDAESLQERKEGEKKRNPEDEEPEEED